MGWNYGKPIDGGGGVPEAPEDGTTYGRKDAGWAPVAVQTLDYAYAFPYQNTSPVEVVAQDTGVNAASLPQATEVLVTCLFEISSTGVTYAITIPINNYLAQIQPEIRQLRSAEPVSGTGDIAIAAWVDSTSGNYFYSLDVDGNGKTLLRVSVVTKTLTAT